MAKQLGMVIDLKACIGCHACTIACNFENSVDFDMSWHRVETVGDPKAKVGQDIPYGTYPNLNLYWIPMPCQHCENPPCMSVCPAQAISKREDGIVLINQDKCIGCKYCSWACPYNVPQFNDKIARMTKCTLCFQRIDKGLTPACVNSCVYNARHFGDVHDPNSEVGKLIASKHAWVLQPEQETKPAIYYVGP